MSRTSGYLKTKNSINWYYEQEGSGPDIVLVPDGMGECAMFSKPMSLIANQGFRVTTFDMPGLSRSWDAPPETYQEVTPQKLAAYVISIVDELGIHVASFWGCSSGGAAMQALLADYPSRVRNAMAHEVPTYMRPGIKALESMSDDEIAGAMSRYIEAFVGDIGMWEGLGVETHARLTKNYPIWARGYIPIVDPDALVPPKDLKGKPLDWTVGADTPTGDFFDNIVTATQLGVPVSTLPGKHFPYVSHADEFAKYVVETTRKYV